MKGYKRKLATGKTVGKHMQNGGLKSFNFHCSPRMVPHLYKPEQQFVELSIKKFVRETNLKNDSLQASKHRGKLTDAEAALLNNYFQPLKEPCKLSLIAFPNFQAFPSGVIRVKHSARAGWLIDAMQHLQGFSSSTTSKRFSFDFSRSHCLTTGSIEQDNERRAELLDPGNHTGSQTDVYSSDVHMPGTSAHKEQLILESTNTISNSEDGVPVFLPQMEQNLADTSIQTGCENPPGERFQFPIDVELAESAIDDARIFCTPPYDGNSPKENVVPDTIDAKESESPVILASKSDLDITDLSPRLTSFIKSGFVPESPLAEYNRVNKKGRDDTDCHLPDDEMKKATPVRCVNALAQTREVTPTAVVDKVNTLFNENAKNPSGVVGNSENLSMQNMQSPLQNLTNSSCSEDWRLSSGEKSGTGKSPKLKRLRKIGDLAKTRPQYNLVKSATCSSADLASTDGQHNVIKRGRVKKLFKDARDFIDEEAEVSSDVVLDSEDEAIHETNDIYEDSFIDDQLDATARSSQAEECEDGKLDMMAIYRRSLLTQSPFQEQQKHSPIVSPISVPSVSTIAESGECSVKTSAETPQGPPKYNFSGRSSLCSPLRHVTCEKIPSHGNNPLVNKTTTGSRKRKQYSNKPFILPVKNLEKEFSLHSGFSSKENKPSYLANGMSSPGFLDDQFYEGIDLDELEAQAAKVISQRSGPSMHSRRIPEPSVDNNTILDAPSFDLGFS